MRVAMGLVGSRGDVQPGLLVARELAGRGHDVRLGVAPNLVGLARSHGLAATPLGVDSREFLASDLVRRGMREGGLRSRLAAAREVAVHDWSQVADGLLELAGDTDVVVTGLLGQEMGSAVAEASHQGFVALHYAPVRANRSVPILPGLAAGRPTEAAWWLGERVRWWLTRESENAQRARLGLPQAVTHVPSRLRDRGAVEVQAYASQLVPELEQEWGPRRPFTGFLGATAGPASVDDPELESFLARTPVYVGFGSMPVEHPEELAGVLARVARENDVDILLVAGWNQSPPRPGERVLVRSSVDHVSVLPRCRAIVHHGGAGTVGAALRSGRPQVVCWWSADQPVWGRLLERAGVGVSMRFADLDAPALVAALDRVLTPGPRRRASHLARVVTSAEQAVCGAADIVERAT